jgi:hypothetical protein
VEHSQVRKRKESARFIFEVMATLKYDTGSWCDFAGKKGLQKNLRTKFGARNPRKKSTTKYHRPITKFKLPFAIRFDIETASNQR